MPIADPDFPVTAVIYSDGSDFDAFLQEVAATMADQGMRLAGFVQHNRSRPGRTKCDMYLRDLSTGALHGISDDRGPLATGCVLNTGRLLNACEAAAAGLAAETDLLVLSKFGKAEAEGGGFRSLMIRALELSVPVLIGVPLINLAPFRIFAEGLAREVELSDLLSDRRAAVGYLRSACRPGRETTAVA